MQLTLYKKAYIDPLHPGIVRLLFEGVAPINGGEDFYLYMWVNETGVLTSFQAILGDTVGCTYHSGTGLSFGKISSSIMNRSITQRLSPGEEGVLRNVIEEIRHSGFQDLLNAVKKKIHGESLACIRLTDAETAIFKNISGEADESPDRKS